MSNQPAQHDEHGDRRGTGTRDRVRGWVDDHTGKADDTREKYLATDGGAPTARQLRHQQQVETSRGWVGPGFGVSTDAQWKGFLVGSLTGGAIGLVLFLPLGFLPWAGPLWLRLLVAGIAGALGGGTAGALYWGGRLPELEGEVTDADGRGSVGTTLRDPRSNERGR